ncbi:hypothetical protein [Streptomyces sp. NPDC049555]|uniref:hypothetical protein n=1 Tax=unclassified Streptomyces TaxID=2593676 RepID=UPI003435FBA1
MLRQVQQCCQHRGSGGAMGELQAFDGDLGPEVRALAQALRDLFAGLGVSTRRYAARRSYDSSTVSRFLSGQRLPRWEFVLNLLHDVAEKRGTVPTPETMEMLRGLHNAALEAGKSPVHRVQLLQQRLAAADQESLRAAQRERWLEDTLRDREHRIRDLQLQLGTGRADGEAARLREEVRQLREELAESRELHRRAEERCAWLEGQLAEAERRLKVTDPVPSDSVLPAADSWARGEALAEALTVQLTGDGRPLGNGLLLDPRTVVTTAAVVRSFGASDEVGVGWMDKRVRGVLVERQPPEHEEPRKMWPFPNLAVVRLISPVVTHTPSPGLDMGWIPAPGTRLVVCAYGIGPGEEWGPYSCGLEVGGRTGGWLRAQGEFVNGLAGAPAFQAGTGLFAGLVSAWYPERSRGLLTPVRAFRTLAAVGSGTVD